MKFTPRAKLTPLAAAAIIPSMVAGIAFSIMPFVNGSSPTTLTAHATARPAHPASHLQPSAHRSATRATATTAAKPPTATAQPAAATQSPTSSQPASGGQVATTSGQSLTAGMSAFEQCVAWRESGNTPTDPDGLFGILPSVWAQLGYSGTAGQASVAQQEAAFNQLYAQYGAQPWAPSDGC
jgi:hypothetical protein